jgi:hypothetical protein
VISQHKHKDWRCFWSRVNALLGYDYGGYLGDPDQNRIWNGLSDAGLRTREKYGQRADNGRPKGNRREEDNSQFINQIGFCGNDSAWYEGA